MFLKGFWVSQKSIEIEKKPLPPFFLFERMTEGGLFFYCMNCNVNVICYFMAISKISRVTAGVSG